MNDKKEEVNYVAKAQNWEQRILVENKLARVWEKNWGSLYQGEESNNSHGLSPDDDDQEDYYQSRIDALQKEMDKIKVPRIASWTRVSYKPPEHGGYREWQDFKRRSQQVTSTEPDEEDSSNIPSSEKQPAGTWSKNYRSLL